MASKKASAFDSVQGLRLTVMSFTSEEKWGLIYALTSIKEAFLSSEKYEYHPTATEGSTEDSLDFHAVY